MSWLTIGGATVALIAASLRAVTEASELDASLAETFDLRSGRAWLALIVLAALALGVGPLLRSRIRQPALVAAVGRRHGRRRDRRRLRRPRRQRSGPDRRHAAHRGPRCSRQRVDRRARRLGALPHQPRPPDCLAGRAALLGRCPRVGRHPRRHGHVQALRQLDERDAITGSDYGRALITKLAVIVVLLAVAGLSRFVLRRRSNAPAAQLRRVIGAELVVAAVVFGITGWLAGASPIVTADSGPVTVTADDTTGTATATATITPAATGPNSIHVTIDDPGGRTPDEVQMTLTPTSGRIAPIDVTTHVAPGMR